jgi:hypothetical protein
MSLLDAVEYVTSDPSAGLPAMDVAALRIGASDQVARVKTTPVL